VCGIAAVSTCEAGGLDARALVRDALQALRHRGPDATGISGSVQSCIGMCRLAVRGDVSIEVPFRSARAGHIRFAYNGEVYCAGIQGGGMIAVPRNGVEEAEALAGGGPVDGMFAMFERYADGRIRARRDGLGIKPLFIREHRLGVAAASELRPLLSIFEQPRIRSRAVAQFLSFGRVLDGGTFYEGVRPVPAGSRVTIDRGRVTDVRAPERHAVHAEPECDAGTLRAAVTEAVRRCLVTDRPLGLAVSGGLDSTILAAELSLLGVRDIETVSVLPVSSRDGVRNLSELCLPGHAWRTWRHHTVTFGPDDWLQSLRETAACMGQPSSLTSDPLYGALGRLAGSAGVVVLLLGEGADELFAGYESYLSLGKLSRAAQFYSAHRDWSLLAALIGREATEAAREFLDHRVAEYSSPSVIDTIRAFEIEHSLQPLLTRADHLLMRSSVEGRVPFLHGRIPRLAWGISSERLLQPSVTKSALRSAYASLLPRQSTRRKIPFRPPMSAWLHGPLGERLAHVIHDGRELLLEAGFQETGLRRLLAGMAENDPSCHSLAPPIASLVAWLISVRQAGYAD